jgi:DNA adenine methylase
MGFASTGATGGRTGFRTDTKCPSCTPQHDWSRYPAALAAVGERFAAVLVEQRPGHEVMRDHDTPDTLHFVDPPYLHGTRSAGSKGCYRHEMSDEEHRALLDTLGGLDGMVVLCGYDSDLYRAALPGWTARYRDVAASGRTGSTRRREVLWMNPASLRGLDNGGLFRGLPLAAIGAPE